MRRGHLGLTVLAVMERETESLVSTERLSCDSPVMWPDQNFCELYV